MSNLAKTLGCGEDYNLFKYMRTHYVVLTFQQTRILYYSCDVGISYPSIVPRNTRVHINLYSSWDHYRKETNTVYLWGIYIYVYEAVSYPSLVSDKVT
jgi:hypothetical protein